MTLKEELHKIYHEQKESAKSRAKQQFKDDIPNHIEYLKNMVRRGCSRVVNENKPQCSIQTESNDFYIEYSNLMAKWLTEQFGPCQESGRGIGLYHFWELVKLNE